MKQLAKIKASEIELDLIYYKVGFEIDRGDYVSYIGGFMSLHKEEVETLAKAVEALPQLIHTLDKRYKALEDKNMSSDEWQSKVVELEKELMDVYKLLR